MQSDKPYIVLVGPVNPKTGGMETYIQALLDSEEAKAIDLQLFDISKPWVRKKQSRKYTGYAASLRRNLVVSLTSYFQSLYFLLRFIYRFFKKKPDLVHLHTASYTSFWEKMFYIHVCNWMRVPVILHVHGALFENFYYKQTLFVRKYIRHMLIKCNHILVLSQYWYDLLTRLTDPHKVTIVPNGVDTSIYSEIVYPKSEIPSMLFLGELSKRKGIFDLLKVIQALASGFKDFIVYIAGPGDTLEIKKLAKEYDIEKQIYLIGPVFDREKLQLLQSSWIFILPSYAEAQPMSVIEAMASGTAVISTKVGGIPEMVIEPENGYLTDPGDIQHLKKVAELLLNHKQLCEKKGMANINKAKELFDINTNMQKILNCYYTLLS